MFDVADPGRDRLARDRPRDGEGEAQGRDREVLRRRHLAQAEAAREAEGGQEADEAGRRGRGAAGGVPRGAEPEATGRSERSSRRRPSTGARHLYVHLPFCAHRCGYCDFVTAVGRRGRARAATSTRCSPSSSSSASSLAPRLETIFLGGGTPTFTEPAALERLLAALAGRRRGHGRGEPRDGDARARRGFCDGTVSIACRSAHRASTPHLLDVLERARGPTTSGVPFYVLRDAGFDNLSLDLIYGIPGQSAADLERDLAEALALEPEHVSAYELEAKPGTRFTHAHGAELERQAESMESYFELVVETLTGGRLPLVRDGELLPRARSGGGRDLRVAAQPRLLARARLPRPRRRRGQHNREPALAERAVAPRLPRGARGGPPPAARASRSSRRRRARPSA